MLHWAFDIMVGIGTALLVLGAVARGIAWLASGATCRGRPGSCAPWPSPGVAAIVALECGWIVTEVGRQPYIVYGFMRTKDAVTEASGVWISLGARARRSTPLVGTATVARAARDGAPLAGGRARRAGALRARDRPARAHRGAGVSTRRRRRGGALGRASRSTRSSAAPTSAPGSGPWWPGAASAASAREP